VTDSRRALPSVGALLQSPGVAALLARAPRGLVVGAVRDTIDVARRDPRQAPQSDDAWTEAVARTLDETQRASLRPVLNATGVVLHTNLGRAPLAEAALAAIARVASGYTNLEYDIESGERGSRYSHCSALIREITGAEDALVVNNGAAALILALDTMAQGKESIVSRGELIEIGGSFRIPDIMSKSGTQLVEVGTTNRTTAADYAKAVSPHTGAIVKVHRSNFAMDGFVAEASTRELADLAEKQNIPLIHDLGSGLLIPLDSIGLTGEPTAGDAIRAGASVVTMSGDKLLGGPQAGLLIGSKAWVARAREPAHPGDARGQAHARRPRGHARVVSRSRPGAARDPRAGPARGVADGASRARGAHRHVAAHQSERQGRREHRHRRRRRLPDGADSIDRHSAIGRCDRPRGDAPAWQSCRGHAHRG
jgi:L-seryl-tRNA(Ser) seleniumtransferase